MDANGTRFHLLLGKADWLRARIGREPALAAAPDSPPAPPRSLLAWDDVRHEVTLWENTFTFKGAKGDRAVRPSDRRGAARDRFDNWYWIAPDERSILVQSTGTRWVSTFWPAEEAPAAPADGAFRPVAAGRVEPLTLRGLAVTDDHYLVVGTANAPGERDRAGILVFDLYAGGPPRHRRWSVDFAPFAIAPRRAGEGGVWILDREHRRVWQVDARFEVVARADAIGAPAAAPDFVGADPTVTLAAARAPRSAEQGWLIDATDPVSVVALPGGGVLVLEREGADHFARVLRLDDGQPRGRAVTTRAMSAHIKSEPGDRPFALVGHDFALVERATDDSSGHRWCLYVADASGNQSYAFDVTTDGDQLVLEPMAEYYPMRLFGGRALVVADGAPWYDCGERWVQLTMQRRPRYAEEGELWTPALDGGEPGCVWHRLMLDACIPAGTAVDVYTRASDDARHLETSVSEEVGPDEHIAWQREPTPYLRADGPELPHLPREAGEGRGTWELLFQQARGRYLQIRLVLRGDGRSTPRLRALRAWYPRFSYLERYLPAVYREDTTSASFLDRFLANAEGTFTAIEDRIAAAQLLFDVASAPPDALDWLGQWFGVAMDPSWEDDRRRLFLRHAMEFFAARGTLHGLQLALRLALDECVDDRMFDRSNRAARRAAPVRIIERFRARRTPPALLGDVSVAVPGPRRLDTTARWRPAAGGAELHRRYRDALPAAGTAFPFVAPDEPAAWTGFAESVLGFAPRAGAAERTRWQEHLRSEYVTVSDLNAAHGANWSGWAQVDLPRDEPVQAALAADWTCFLAARASHAFTHWRAFLARRYRSAAALNAAWGTHWSSIASVALHDRLPPDGPALADWFEFEGTVLEMHRTAHRFTVMVPVSGQQRTDTPAQQRRLAIARKVLELEKPAHTVFDMRFFWAMFRLGEARLGDDTLIDRGSRSPGLMSPMVLGEGYLAQSFLAARPGADAPARMQIGRDRVGRSNRLGGP